ncbi:MAG: alpha-galactosidase [Alicyclobacillus herbarius]|uniref:alpha-galactosidase n=1 Tax=Alicyclobacillus herbarius TaxID=122960 RepID=UPI002356A69B|nr:alpha-galactosidase [Alicyclobacillus herbarius]MCL6633087.1 alpha-galactosidase [Alicyclobacillus herbarius]
MPISYDASCRQVHLQTPNTSYVLQVTEEGYVTHLYWGPRLRNPRLQDAVRLVPRAFSPNPDPNRPELSLDTLPQEYPGASSDFRAPAFVVGQTDGSTVSDLRYQTHRILPGKPKLAGLPATYVESADEAETLELDLMDDVSGLTVTLVYSVFRDFDAIARSVRFQNRGTHPLQLLEAHSVNVDFADDAFDLLHLSGAWGRERHVVRQPLRPGTQSVESRRGTSSHQHNPFIALLRKDTNLHHGEVYGLNLVYSGNFLARVEVDQFATARLSLGIHPSQFAWRLHPGDTFQTPEVVMTFSNRGLTGMSQTFHALYRSRLCRGTHRDKPRPILINSWEAMYFDFDVPGLERLAKEAKELGIELFVLDDGWFGKRNDDTTSLGDWVVNRDKIPCGLDGLAQRIHDLGLSFGLWVEPEMVSPDSDLFRAHPDWCLHVPGRNKSLGRNQLVLDLSRDEVCDYVIETMTQVFSSAPIDYVKWDMNRHLTEVASAAWPADRQKEVGHRYILGLYRILETLTARFPHILFESCSGGGGRFDPGMLYYMPQTWTSDDTDAWERVYIQFGTSLVYPPVTMGAHVSSVPNHQVGRITPLRTRGDVAMSANLGYELDVSKLGETEKQEIRRQIATYKAIRSLVQFGVYYPLQSPFDGPQAAWMFVSADQREAVVFWFGSLAEPNGRLHRVRLAGLRKDLTYQVSDSVSATDLRGQPETDSERPQPVRVNGDELMAFGLAVPYPGHDFQSAFWHLRAVEEPTDAPATDSRS